MRQTKLKKEIAIIGSFPPPYGGISVHLKQLSKWLEFKNINYTLFNTHSASESNPNVVSINKYKKLWYLKFLAFHEYSICHLYSTSWFSRLAFGISAAIRPGKYIISIHGRSISTIVNRRVSIKRQITKWILHQMDIVIACNEEIKKECISELNLNPNTVFMIPAYIVPAEKRKSTLPNYLLSGMRDASPVLFAVGWVGQKYMGNDIYGFDMLIKLIENLKKDYPRIKLILSINGGQNDEVMEFTEHARKRLDQHIIISAEDIEDISSIFKASDLFIRPTNTDGDSVSIREALFWGTPVIASDIVKRPEQCLTFRNRNIESLENTVRSALTNLGHINSYLKNNVQPNNAVNIINVYKKLIKDRVYGH